MPANPPSAKSELIEFDWGGCPLTDRGSVDEIDAVIGSVAHYYGRPGIVEAMWLKEGAVPWPGPPAQRPVYRVRWKPTDGCICDPASWPILHAKCAIHGVPAEDLDRAGRWLREKGLVE